MAEAEAEAEAEPIICFLKNPKTNVFPLLQSTVTNPCDKPIQIQNGPSKPTSLRQIAVTKFFAETKGYPIFQTLPSQLGLTTRGPTLLALSITASPLP
jgi:hypothetical protein